MKSPTFIAGALAFASQAYAVQNATFCTDANAVCYAINVPEATASNGGAGNLYFQIRGPATMRWIGFGQGDQMAGANMFVIYADAAGTNVTLSARHGSGEVMPLADATTHVTLLEGSGIANGQMVANVLCTTCNKWTGGATMDFDDSSATFIWAYLQGDALKSDSVSAPIAMHDDRGTATFNLATAAGGSSANPFLTDAEAGPGRGSAPGLPTPAPPGGGGGSSGASARPSAAGSTKFTRYLKAHGILGPVAFVLLFPLGAVMIRLLSFRGLVYVHAAWQLVGLGLAGATLGLGLWLANTLHYRDRAHAILGIVAIAGVLAQPVTGLAHHLLYRRRHGAPNVATYPHVWLGRAFILLGIVNAGLGLRLAGDNSRGGKIAYIVVAAVMGVVWLGVDLVAAGRGRRGKAALGTREARAAGPSPSESESPRVGSRGPDMAFRK